MRIIIEINQTKWKTGVSALLKYARFSVFAVKAFLLSYPRTSMFVCILTLSVFIPVRANKDIMTLGIIDFSSPIVSAEESTPLEVKSKSNKAPNKNNSTPKRFKTTLSSNKHGVGVKDMNEDELRKFMKSKGYKSLEKLNKPVLRRLYLAYEYDALFWDVHEKSGFPISMVFAFFIYEATLHGVETDLWTEHWNAGGLKYRGKGDFTLRYDDCRDSKGRKIPCKFQSHDTYDAAVNAMSATLSKERYYRCKTYRAAVDICKCMYDQGYSTGNNWAARAYIMRQYWELRNHFPVAK